MTPVAPIGAHALLIFLSQVGLLLLLALVLGSLAARLRLPSVVGELLAGVLVGPSLLANLAPDFQQWLFPAQAAQMNLLDAVGQIGVVLLVGMTGIHMDMGLVRRRAATAAGVSLGGLVVPLGLGIAAGFLIPEFLIPSSADGTVFALFLGVAMCVSAIPVLAKTLMDMRLIHRNIGQLSLTAGMIDDAFGWVMLSIVSAMAVAAVTTGTVLTSLAFLAVIIIFALTVGRPLVRGSFRLAARSNQPGATVATTVVLILMASAATHALGLEAVFGAFVMGILIGSVGKVDVAKLAPLRTVVLGALAPVFFATAGLRMDMSALTEPPVLLAGLAILALAIVGKFVGVYVGARLSRLNRWEALALGAGLNARGVIEVVVAMVGLRLGILSVEIYTIILLVAVVTSVMAPPILRVAMARVERSADEELRETAYKAWEKQPAA